MPRAAVAFYGDDFTGSVDVLLQFSRHGLTGRLFTRLPPLPVLARAAEEVDVVGVAGIARSLAAGDLEPELVPVLTALRDLGTPVVQYKACSTADSSPSIGSIGRVVELGRAVFGERAVPMLFAQPDFGRYTSFGHHFAREGETVYRLDRQPTMSQHPSTPMRESDLARHLAAQTALPIGSLPWTEYDDKLAARLVETDAAAVVLDALTDEHVEAVGRAVRAVPGGPVFAIGSGGLSRGLAAATGASRRELPVAGVETGPVLALSGSRSPQTRRQADAAAAAGWLVEPLRFDDGQAPAVVRALGSDRSVVLTSDDAEVPGEGALERIADAAASVVSSAVRAGVTRRVIVCGGDTSSRVTRLLHVEALSIAANPVANVVLLRAHSADAGVDGLELLLKGGQVGPADLFELVRAPGP